MKDAVIIDFSAYKSLLKTSSSPDDHTHPWNPWWPARPATATVICLDLERQRRRRDRR